MYVPPSSDTNRCVSPSMVTLAVGRLASIIIHLASIGISLLFPMYLQNNRQLYHIWVEPNSSPIVIRWLLYTGSNYPDGWLLYMQYPDGCAVHAIPRWLIVKYIRHTLVYASPSSVITSFIPTRIPPLIVVYYRNPPIIPSPCVRCTLSLIKQNVSSHLQPKPILYIIEVFIAGLLLWNLHLDFYPHIRPLFLTPIFITHQ